MICAVPRTGKPCTSAAGRHRPQGVSGRCRRAVDRQIPRSLPGRRANRIAELALAKRKGPRGNSMAANERSDLKLHLHHAPIEIERKFLIANDAWKQSVVGTVNIRDGLIASYRSRKVRVRISDQIAVITIKGPRSGIARAEYEYEIPLADAE